MNNIHNVTMTKYFDADRPIEHREQDRLMRRPFAEAIAQYIRTIPAGNGFTVAVSGEWGSGKTSILNMVAEALEEESETISVLRFNPWLFGGTSDLMTRFFQELSAQLGQSQSDKVKTVAKALSSLGQSLAPLSPVPGTAVLANVIAGQTANWAKPRSLLAERKHLENVLADSDSRVVVLIDDIDRLEPRETRELMRLVRLTSDLPNVVFLLAFDRQVVAESLNEPGMNGEQYLAKIVQINQDLPSTRGALLQDLLLSWLEELIRGRDLAQFDNDVWNKIFFDVIKPLLGNVRDVKRYLCSLPVTLDSVGQEVALADLLGLEAVRVLRPSMYEALKARAEYLVHSESQSGFWISEEARNSQIQQELETMLEHAGRERGILKSVLQILFPATEGFLGGSWYRANWDVTWRKQRRVACEEVLQIYLLAGLDEGSLRSQYVENLYEALADEDRLTPMLDSLDENQFERALERLQDFEHDFPTEAVPVAVPVFANRMGKLSPDSASFFGFSPRLKAHHLIYRLLNRITDPGALAAVLPEILGKVVTLSGRIQVIDIVGHREGIGNKLASEEQAMELEFQFVDQLKSATARQLAEEWDIFALSFRAMQLLEDEPRNSLSESLREHLTEDSFVLNLLRTAVGSRRFDNGRVEKLLPWDGW